jgi:hypothetical protein
MIPISQQVRSHIIDLLKNGISTRTAADLAKVSQSAVWRLRKTLNLEQVKPAAGRHRVRVLSPGIQREIGRLVESGRVG